MPGSLSQAAAARAAVAASVLIWVVSWMPMKASMAYIGPFDFVAWRYALGTVPLFIGAWLSGERLRMPAWGPVILTGIFQTAAFQCLVQWALVSGGAGKTSMLVYTMPFWMVLLAWLVLGQRPARRHWQGMLLAGAGLVCIIEPWRGIGTMSSALLAVAGGLAWAIGTLAAKHMFDRYRPGMLAFTAWQMLFGTLAVIPLAWAVPQMPTQWNAPLLLGLAYCVLAATSLAWWLWLIALRNLPAAVAALSGLGVPLGAALLAWFTFGERPSSAGLAGMVLVLAGLARVNWTRGAGTPASRSDRR